MKVIAKNFNSATHKILEQRNGIFLNFHVYKVEGGIPKYDQIFFKAVFTPQGAKEARIALLQKIEKYYGIQLLKPQFTFEQYNLN